MATQVQQVFYIEDPVEKHFKYPVKRLSTESYDTQDADNEIDDSIQGQFSNDSIFRSIIEEQDHEVSCFRKDVPLTRIPIPSYEINQTDQQLNSMEIDRLTLRLHHKGDFSKSSYIGGLFDVFELDPDTFSYSVLMEFVKDLKYAEIGGVYVCKGKKGGWKLVYDDTGVGDAIKGKSEIDFYIDCTIDKSVQPMKQMQPHVIVRPRSNVVKKTFVTLKSITDAKTQRLKDRDNEKERRLNTKKKLDFKDVPDGGLLGLSDFEKLFEGCGENSDTEKNGEALEKDNENAEKEDVGKKFTKDIGNAETGQAATDKLEKDSTGKGCNEYEKNRNKNVAANKEKLRELGLLKDKPAATTSQKDKGKGQLINDAGSESEYIPTNDNLQEQNDDDEEGNNAKVTKKRKRQRVQDVARPRTRGQANLLTNENQKRGTIADSVPVEPPLKDTPVISVKDKLKNLREGPGSMTAYLEMRERERLQRLHEKTPQPPESEPEHFPSQSETIVAEAPKRKRGQTKMNHIHNSTEKKIITLNDLSQPISRGTANSSASQFSNFLGSTIRQFVSLTCASWHEVPEKELLWEYVKDKYIVPEEAKRWVMRTLCDLFRSHKSRIKRDHYYPYDTDEKRLENRPREVPLEDWKVLLKYWGDEKIKRTAEKNSAARKKIKDTHTTGPKSFAEIAEKMLLQKELEMAPIDSDVPEEERAQVVISDADLYLETRKRKAGRKYKLNEDELKEVNAKYDKVKFTLQTEGSEAANKLVRGGKNEHNPCYLYGRLMRKSESKTKSSTTATNVTDDFMSDVTARIRGQLEEEMEEKVDQKFREMVKRLAEKNPGLNLMLDESDHKTADEEVSTSATP